MQTYRRCVQQPRTTLLAEVAVPPGPQGLRVSLGSAHLLAPATQTTPFRAAPGRDRIREWQERRRAHPGRTSTCCDPMRSAACKEPTVSLVGSLEPGGTHARAGSGSGGLDSLIYAQQLDVRQGEAREDCRGTKGGAGLATAVGAVADVERQGLLYGRLEGYGPALALAIHGVSGEVKWGFKSLG